MVYLDMGVLQIQKPSKVSPGNVGTVPRHLKVVHPHSLGHVVVLPAPAPVLVGEPVDEVEMFDSEGCGPSEDPVVWQLVVELVHGHRHVSRLAGTGVEVTVVLWYEVNIVEHCRARSDRESLWGTDTDLDSPSLRPAWPPCNQR